ncbi:MAG: 4-oxalocrotonate tautomerase family protein [Sphingomonadales bacterium]|nr:MAG: 4-oxalocrotonate tautomerase family protein [Sphingomonadales bacterium]
MPIVQANILKGRTAEAKADFARAVTDAAVAHLGVPPQAVRVLISEVEPEHWFTAGEPKAPIG